MEVEVEVAVRVCSYSLTVPNPTHRPNVGWMDSTRTFNLEAYLNSLDGSVEGIACTPIATDCPPFT